MLKYILFNFYTRQAFNGKLKYQGLGKRAVLMQMDFQYHLQVCVPLILLGIIISQILLVIHIPNGFCTHLKALLPYMGFNAITLFIMNKDFFSGQSIVKRIKGYKIVDYKTQQQAGSLQCVIRNCTMIIWPIEVIIVMFSPQRRLGDFIARTMVIKVEKSDPELVIYEIKALKFNRETATTLLVSICIVAFNQWIVYEILSDI